MSDLLQSLIASGIDPPAAVRISNAITSLLPKVPEVAAAAAKSVSKAMAEAAPITAAAAPPEPDPAGPTTFTGSIETQQSAVFSGDSQFFGGLTIDGDVTWRGMPIEPATVQTVAGLAVSDGNLFFTPGQMAVMSDYGPGKSQRIVFSASPGATGQFLTGATLNSNSTSVTVPTGFTFTPTTSSVTVPTGFTFSPDSCSITPSGSATITYLTGGTISQSGSTSVSVLSSASISTTASTAWTGGVANVSATGIEDPE